LHHGQGDQMSLWKKLAQNVAQNIFCQHWYIDTLKKTPKIWDSFVIFDKNCQSKQSPIGRKLSQFGHPAVDSPVTK
jgi:hypothetical protein